MLWHQKIVLSLNVLCDVQYNCVPGVARGMARKRQRMVFTHCSSCGQPMDETVCNIDWHAVYVSQCVKTHMTKMGRIPTFAELVSMDHEMGSDPCDDCCCGSCGSRKASPGTACC